MNTNRMSCSEVRERLPLYVGGDLDPELMEAVHGHLGSCGECTDRASEATRARRALVAAFRARESELPRPELWTGIRARLRAEGLVHAREDEHILAAPALQAVPRRARRSRWTFAVASIAAAVVLVAGVQQSGLFSSHAPVNPVKLLPDPTVATTPVALPRGLERVSPAEDRLAPQYKRMPRPGEGTRSAAGEILPAAYLPPGSK